MVAELTDDQKVLVTSALKFLQGSGTGVKASVIDKLEKELKSKGCLSDAGSAISLGDLLKLWNSDSTTVSSIRAVRARARALQRERERIMHFDVGIADTIVSSLPPPEIPPEHQAQAQVG